MVWSCANTSVRQILFIAANTPMGKHNGATKKTMYLMTLTALKNNGSLLTYGTVDRKRSNQIHA